MSRVFKARFLSAHGMTRFGNVLQQLLGAESTSGRESVPARRRPRVHYGLTREGAIYFAIIALIAAAALNTGNNLLFLVLAVLLAGIFISGILAKLTLSGFAMDVRLPDRIFALEWFDAHLTARNRNRVLPAFSFSIRKARKTEDSGKFQQEPRGEIMMRSLFAPFIPPRGSVTENVDLNFTRRGRYPQLSFEVSSKFPFSIVRRKWNITASGEMIVLPRIRLDGSSAAFAARIRGEIASRVKGQGCDLYALRDYQPGDPARDVNWKATAKRGQLMVREFARDEEVGLILYFDHVLSNPRDTNGLARFERAVSFCAALAWEASINGWMLRFVGGGVQTGVARATDIIYQVLEALAVIEPAGVSETCPLAPIIFDNVADAFAVVVTDRPASSPYKGWLRAGRVIAMEDL